MHCFFCLFSVLVDNDLNKSVLSVADDTVKLSLHKEQHPSDSEDFSDIGLSSEEEADGLEDTPHIRRKYRRPSAPMPVPAPAPPAPVTSDTVQVDRQVLEEMQSQIVNLSGLVSQMAGGDPPNLPSF